MYNGCSRRRSIAHRSFQLHPQEYVADFGRGLSRQELELGELFGFEVVRLDIVVKLPQQVGEIRAVLGNLVYGSWNVSKPTTFTPAVFRWARDGPLSLREAIKFWP